MANAHARVQKSQQDIFSGLQHNMLPLINQSRSWCIIMLLTFAPCSEVHTSALSHSLPLSFRQQRALYFVRMHTHALGNLLSNTHAALARWENVNKELRESNNRRKLFPWALPPPRPVSLFPADLLLPPLTKNERRRHPPAPAAAACSRSCQFLHLNITPLSHTSKYTKLQQRHEQDRGKITHQKLMGSRKRY
jgi:hypothetical protein